MDEYEVITKTIQPISSKRLQFNKLIDNSNSLQNQLNSNIEYNKDIFSLYLSKESDDSYTNKVISTENSNSNDLRLKYSDKGIKRHSGINVDYWPLFKKMRSDYNFFESNSNKIINKYSSSKSDSNMITDMVLEFYEFNHQLKEIYVSKMKLRDILYSIMKSIFPYCGLYVIGSSMNGFGSILSDMDICLMLSHIEIDQKKEAKDILLIIQKFLSNHSFIQNLTFIHAKVPILKFTDRISNVECDLNINNSIGIRNTHLLNAYSSMDIRVAQLVLFVKHWAKKFGINDASQGTISSYSLALMVIHFLQCGCSPPMLPSLQQKYPHKFNNTLDIRSLSLNQNLAPYRSNNDQTTGELFVGFIKFYANDFNFEKEVISVRLGKTFSKKNKLLNNSNQWKYIYIEEPFNLSNTAYSVYDKRTYLRILNIFKYSDFLLGECGNMLFKELI